MAGNWIKMRTDLFTHPKIVRISSALKADTHRTVGGLMAVWCLFDAHSVDGRIQGYTVETLDDQLRWPGFAAAMVAVDWLGEEGGSLVLPGFEVHNGASAKRRAQDADRKKEARKASARIVDEPRTRIEKNTEDREGAPGQPTTCVQPPADRKIGLQAFLEACADRGEEAVPEDDAVFAYAGRIGLPEEYVALAWTWFKRRYADKKQAGIRGWRQTFRNAVEDGWPKFWYQDRDHSWQLTTAGKQAKAARDAA